MLDYDLFGFVELVVILCLLLLVGLCDGWGFVLALRFAGFIGIKFGATLRISVCFTFGICLTVGCLCFGGFAGSLMHWLLMCVVCLR